MPITIWPSSAKNYLHSPKPKNIGRLTSSLTPLAHGPAMRDSASPLLKPQSPPPPVRSSIYLQKVRYTFKNSRVGQFAIHPALTSVSRAASVGERFSVVM